MAMAGYSKTPLPKKLGIKPGSTVALLDAPRGFEASWGAIADEVRVLRTARGRADLVMLFARRRAGLVKRLPAAIRMMADGGGLWIAWPKQASGEPTDVTQPFVRETGLGAGLVDYKIAAIDATWSGLKFARRRPSVNAARSARQQGRATTTRHAAR